MAKGLPTINLELERAQSALAVLRTTLREKLHKDDCKDLDELIDRAVAALDKASDVLGGLRSQMQDAVDRL